VVRKPSWGDAQKKPIESIDDIVKSLVRPPDSERRLLISFAVPEIGLTFPISISLEKSVELVNTLLFDPPCYCSLVLLFEGVFHCSL